MHVVLATTTMYRHACVRSDLALELVRAAQAHYYSLVVVDGGSDPSFLASLGETHAIVIPQTERGMGQARTQALREARGLADDNGIVIWIEPEKHTMVTELCKLRNVIDVGRAHIAIPDRGPLDSYPLDQRLAEGFGNEAFRIMTGQALDMWAGPRAIHVRALHHFLDYQGEYGNLWDQHFIPVMRAIAAGCRVVSVPVQYRHPAEQTASEQGDVLMVMRRLAQLENIMHAVHAEAKKLGWIA